MLHGPRPKIGRGAGVEEHGQCHQADLVLSLFDVAILVALVGRCPLSLDALLLTEPQQAI